MSIRSAFERPKCDEHSDSGDEDGFDAIRDDDDLLVESMFHVETGHIDAYEFPETRNNLIGWWRGTVRGNSFSPPLSQGSTLSHLLFHLESTSRLDPESASRVYQDELGIKQDFASACRVRSLRANMACVNNYSLSSRPEHFVVVRINSS